MRCHQRTACFACFVLSRQRPALSRPTSDQINHPPRPLKRCTLDTYRAVLAVLALYFVVEGQWHPRAVVTVTANAATANCPPLLPTARCQQVARHVVPPASKGGPIMNAGELANCAMLLYELKPTPLLAILPQRRLVLIDVKENIFSASASSLAFSFGTGYCLQSLH